MKWIKDSLVGVAVALLLSITPTMAATQTADSPTVHSKLVHAHVIGEQHDEDVLIGCGNFNGKTNRWSEGYWAVPADDLREEWQWQICDRLHKRIGGK